MRDEERYQQGMLVRRGVLGDEHVDRTLQNLTLYSLLPVSDTN